MLTSTILSTDNPWTFCSLNCLLKGPFEFLHYYWCFLIKLVKVQESSNLKTNQSKTKQTPPFCVLLPPLLLTISSFFLLSLLPNLPLTPSIQHNLASVLPLHWKLLLQEVLYLSSKDWKCCAGIGRPLLSATASSGPGAREELKTWLLFLLGHLLQWPLVNCLLLHLALGF